MLVICSIISDVYCLSELRKSVNDIKEIVKWIEFVKPSIMDYDNDPLDSHI